MARRVGAGGIRIMIEPGDTSAYAIARQFTGEGLRWPELVAANPQKVRNVAGTFQTLIPGETLSLPASWVDCAEARGLAVDDGNDAAGFFETDEAGALPLGWSEDDLRVVDQLAKMWNVDTDDLLVTWYEESGLQPHKMTDVGSGTAPDGRPRYWYGGLIGGLAEQWDGKQGKRIYVIDQSYGWTPGTWEKIVTTMPIRTQLQAIAQIWDSQFKTRIPGKLTLRQYADRMGVSPAAVIHAINFLPAYMSRIQNQDSPIVKPGDPSGGYEGNVPHYSNPNASWGLDVNQDGAISLRDLDLHGQAKLAELEKSNLGTLVAEARTPSPPPATLASLFAPIRGQWESLTGKPPIVTVGWNEPPTPKTSGAGGLLLAVGLGLALWHFTRKG